MSEKTTKVPESQAGAPASFAGRSVPEASPDVVREGFKSNEEQLIAQGVPVVPHVTREAALADEVKRQSADDRRRAKFAEAEAAAAEAAEKARLAAIEGV